MHAQQRSTVRVFQLTGQRLQPAAHGCYSLTCQAAGCDAVGRLPQRACGIVYGQHVPVASAAAGGAAGVGALDGCCQGEGVGAVV